MAKKRTAWAHLPNAKLIDAVLADVKARPDVWVAAWGAARAAARDAAYFAAWGAARAAARAAAHFPAWGAARAAAWVAAYTVAWAAAFPAARDVILALLAWDDCTYLLDLPSDTLRTMADLCDAPVCHQAVLLLPYVLVKEGTPTDLT